MKFFFRRAPKTFRNIPHAMARVLNNLKTQDAVSADTTAISVKLFNCLLLAKRVTVRRNAAMLQSTTKKMASKTDSTRLNSGDGTSQ